MYDILKELHNPPDVRTTTVLEVVFYTLFVGALYYFLDLKVGYTVLAVAVYLVGVYFYDRRKIKQAQAEHKRSILSQAVKEHTTTYQALCMVRNQLSERHFDLGEMRVLYERNASSMAWTQDVSDLYADLTLVTRMLQTELQVREELHDEFHNRLRLLEEEDLPAHNTENITIDGYPWSVI